MDSKQDGVRGAIQLLDTEIEKTEKGAPFPFEEYLCLAQSDPRRVLRNIFQVFYDMVHSCVGNGVDEYPDDPESIGFVKYDCAKLFVEGSDHPFFADRLFANRFVRQIESLRQGLHQNRLYAYEGPSGCGKSTFLNNLLRSFEAYVNTKEGRIYETVWTIEVGVGGAHESVSIPCPSHDAPILIVPKEYRLDFLKKLLSAEAMEKAGMFSEKSYGWLFQNEACTICKSIFRALIERHQAIRQVLPMVNVRPYAFDRRLGEGVSIFNPGDQAVWGMADGKPIGGIFTDKRIQEKLDQAFGPNAVRYIYSPLAKTNNGIYVLMDVKSHNEDRLLELHNVISEGVHKVGSIEERVSSLFFALMNPEDRRVIEEKKMESFQGRIQYNKVPYVLEPGAEVNIYCTFFGDAVQKLFLPRVLENFARVIVASRMNPESETLKDWISDFSKYKLYCDAEGRLLRMEIYGGVIPEWLSEEDKKKFTAPVRRDLIAEGEDEGSDGISGRESLRLFNELVSRYSGRPSLINMANISDFFKHQVGRQFRDKYIPSEFLASILASYDYAVLNEVKEALYFYNKDQIAKDILTFLWAINYEVGEKTMCRYTGEEVVVTLDLLKLMATRLTDRTMKDERVLEFVQEIQKEYTVTKAKENCPIEETELYRELFVTYVRNLKENVLQPFAGNPNFREAVKTYGTPEFETFDTRLREHVEYMVKNLKGKFGYTEQGAREIVLYVIDKNLLKKFS